MPAGRKSKYTPEVVERITQAIRNGMTYELACQYAGISHETFYRWMNEKAEFSAAVKEAEGAGAMTWLEAIQKAADRGEWTAAAWKLERRYPQLYGRRVVDANVKAQIDVTKLSDDELRTLIEGGGGA